MLTVPTFLAVATPLIVMDAIALFEEFQVVVLVMSWIELSENVPKAENGWVVPSGMLAFDGLIAIEAIVALVTVKDAEPWTVPDVPTIVEGPGAIPLARP
jgi:hypothetical protein